MNQEQFKKSVCDWIKSELPELEESKPTVDINNNWVPLAGAVTVPNYVWVDWNPQYQIYNQAAAQQNAMQQVQAYYRYNIDIGALREQPLVQIADVPDDEPPAYRRFLRALGF